MRVIDELSFLGAAHRPINSNLMAGKTFSKNAVLIN